MFCQIKLSEYFILVERFCLLFLSINGPYLEELTRTTKNSKTLSIVGVITGGYFIVTSTEKLSLLTGLSTGVLGLTLTAIATSLPELLTTIFSQKEHDEKMTIGNIIGSNIYNLLLIGGIINLFGNTNLVLQNNWLTLNIVTVFFVLTLLVFKGKSVPKYIGVIFLLFFFLYLFLETGKLD